MNVVSHTNRVLSDHLCTSGEVEQLEEKDLKTSVPQHNSRCFKQGEPQM